MSYANAYADVTTLKSKSYLNIPSTDTDHDTYLRKLLEMASRELDKHCKRHFYCVSATRAYDGAGATLWLPDDLLSINSSSLKLDTDGDATYETILAATDYILRPSNKYPKTRIEINNYGDYSDFADGIQDGVQIAGIFGHGDGESATPYYTTGGTGTVADSSSTALALSVANLVVAGQTIICESEQMYVESVSTTTATVRRGWNGTTAASHNAKAISVYEYPSPIVQACLITAMRAWKRKDSAYQDVVGIGEMGTLVASKGIDPDVAETIKMYRRVRFA